MRHGMRAVLAGILLSGVLAGGASAAASTITLGQQFFTDGQLITGGGPGPVATFEAATATNPAPFHLFNGSDIDPPSFDVTFTFTFAPQTVTAATLTMGIFDSDSAMPGDQVALLTLDGVDGGLTAAANTAFNAHGGTQVEYDVYTITLPGGVLSQLNDGSATVHLMLIAAGGTLPIETSPNGAGIDFATLATSTAVATAVPLPSAAWMGGLGLAALAGVGLWGRGRRICAGRMPA